MPDLTAEAADRLERSVLGGVLRDPRQMAHAAQALTAECFRTDAHRKLWSALAALWDAGGAAVSLAGVADHLHRLGQVADVGYDYLEKLWDDEPTGAHVAYHAGLVRDHALLRGLALAGAEIEALGRRPAGPAEEMLGAAEAKLFALSRLADQGAAAPLADVIREARDRIDALNAARSPVSGLATGHRDLDALTAGLQAGDLVVLAARPSVGKTALGLGLARHAALACGAGVLFASLEQASLELGLRLLCAEARVDSQRVRRGVLTRDESGALARAVGVLLPAPVFVDDGGSQSVLRVAAHARRLARRPGLGLVVVDYLQLVEPEDRKAPRHEQVGRAARRLKALAKELRVPVLCLAQLNREVESRGGDGRPRLSDLRDSGEIEQHADVVLLLHRPPGQHGDVIDVEVLVAKQRNGPVGELTLRYRRPCLRFEDAADATPDPFPDVEGVDLD
jgi:replicative DNA helicase